MTLIPSKNPLLQAGAGLDVTFDCKKMTSDSTIRTYAMSKMQLLKLLRKQNAAEAIGQLYKDCAIFGITKGQFSLIELLSVIIEQTGPVDLFISTWTAARAELNDAYEFIESNKIKSFRCLVDNTFQRREPALATRMRELFGIDSIRVTRNHAKFCLMRNAKWDLVINSSMNLNANPRLENFYIQDHVPLADFLQSIMDEIFNRVEPRALYASASQNNGRFNELWEKKEKLTE